MRVAAERNVRKDWCRCVRGEWGERVDAVVGAGAVVILVEIVPRVGRWRGYHWSDVTL